jgi:hypothetical protein
VTVWTPEGGLIVQGCGGRQRARGRVLLFIDFGIIVHSASR